MEKTIQAYEKNNNFIIYSKVKNKNKIKANKVLILNVRILIK